MMKIARKFPVITGFFLICMTTAGLAGAKEFPEKPIRLLVGFAPGAAVDLTARAMSKVAAKYLGETVVVVNMRGAGGTIAANELVNAPPDGYTTVLMPTAYKSIAIHMQKVSFDPRILKILLGFTEFKSVLFVRADSPYEKFENFIAYGANNPNAITWGHSGRGLATHIIGVLLFRNATVSTVDVPFVGGTSELVNAVLGGHIMASVNSISGVLQHVQAGRLKILLAVTDRRLKELPDVPTLKELGYPDLSAFNTRISIAIHRDTPVDRVKKLQDNLKKAVEDPELDKILDAMGLNSEYFSPEALEEGILDAEKMSTPVLKDLKLFVQ